MDDSAAAFCLSDESSAHEKASKLPPYDVVPVAVKMNVVI